VLHNLKM